MKPFTRTEVILSKFTMDFINDIVHEYGMNQEQKSKLIKIAMEDTVKLFDNEDKK